MNPVKIKEILNSGEPDCVLDFQMLARETMKQEEEYSNADWFWNYDEYRRILWA